MRLSTKLPPRSPAPSHALYPYVYISTVGAVMVKSKTNHFSPDRGTRAWKGAGFGCCIHTPARGSEYLASEGKLCNLALTHAHTHTRIIRFKFCWWLPATVALTLTNTANEVNARGYVCKCVCVSANNPWLLTRPRHCHWLPPLTGADRLQRIPTPPVVGGALAPTPAVRLAATNNKAI